jgi:hypothetical protein
MAAVMALGVTLLAAASTVTRPTLAQSQPAPAEKPPLSSDFEPVAWTRYQVLPFDDGPDDAFASTVAVGNELLAVGAPAAMPSGRVHLFSLTGSTWAPLKTLTSDKLGDAGGLGSSLGVTDTLVVSGAPNDAGSGTAIVFERSGQAWLDTKLTAEESAAGDQYGYAVAVSGNTVIVGAPSESSLDTAAGAAYVFVRDPEGWHRQAKLLAADEAEPGTRTSHLFGASVAIAGNAIVVGAPYEPAAYVFERVDGIWNRSARLSQNEPQPYDQFGIAVGLSGSLIAVGADLRDDLVHGADSGAVFAYVRGLSGWPQVESQVLGPKGMNEGAGFGYRLGLDQNALVVSAFFGDPGNTVYSFLWQGQFEASTVLAPDDLLLGDAFGPAVSTFQQQVIVGVPNDTGSGGSVHAFARAAGNGCSSGPECWSGACVEGVCCDSACDASCESCLASRKSAGSSGTCGLVNAGTDPRSSCQPASCLNEGTEDPADYCNALGVCVETAARSCYGYACSDAKCNGACSEDSDCDVTAGYVCAAGVCAVPLGGACTSDTMCESGHCAEQDGVCCDAPCDGACESCRSFERSPEPDGVCRLAPAGTDPDEECEKAPDQDLCGATGSCNGTGQCHSFAPVTTACGPTTCTPEGQVQGKLCDGEGECSKRVSNCAPFLCRGSKCLDSCSTDSDCASDAFCISDSCVAGPVCSDDGLAVLARHGQRTECAPFRCHLGACLETCSFTSDCAPNHACIRDTRSCAVQQARRASVSGCSSANAFWPRGREFETTPLLLSSLLLLLRQRRSIRKPSCRQ